MMTAFYMFRLVYLTFFNDFRGTEDTKKHIHESPAIMTIPLIVLAALSIIGGFIGMPSVFGFTHQFQLYISSVTDASKELMKESIELNHSMEWVLIATAVVAAIVSILYARFKYLTKKEQPSEDITLAGLDKVVYNKFYVDEIYDSIIVKPLKVLSDLFLVLVDKLIIDLFVNAVAWFVGLFGRTLRLVQSGNTGFYVFAMVFGIIVLFVIRLLI